MADLEKYAEEFNVKDMFISMVSSAFGFLLAFWYRDVIKETIETYMPAGEGLLYKWFITFVLTIVVVIILYVLVKIKKANLVPDELEEGLKNKTTRRVKKRIKKTIGMK